MDLESIISELRNEQERIGRVISSLLGTARPGTTKRGRKAIGAKKRGGISPEGRRRLALAMKRRWAERRARVAAPKPAAKAAVAKKRGGLTAAGRKRLSQAMKRRWAAKKESQG